MRKKIIDGDFSRAKKREIKKRPRMALHGRGLLTQSAHGGKKLARKV